MKEGVVVMPVAGAFSSSSRRYFVSTDQSHDLSWSGLWVNAWKQIACFWIVDLMVLAAAGFGHPFSDDPDRVRVREIMPLISWGGYGDHAVNLARAYRPEVLP